MTFPKTLPSGFLDRFPKLSREQAGHLRHIHNLATALPGEYPHMGTQIAGQEWLDSLRYQLSGMVYAASVAHYHRLPALRSVFRQVIEALIEKMLYKDVWSYWYLTSQSGRLVDPDIQELRKPWPDPVVKENIMYSGHLLLMISLHAMLFNDDKFDQPDAIVFDWNPIFWGMGPERFSYTRSTLQDAIIREMERANWIGVCCEPNSVFVVCNQFPIIAMRYNDIRKGTNTIEGVLEKYIAAWKSKSGFLQEDGLFVDWYQVKQDQRVPAQNIGFTAWACTFMNAWNPDQMKALFPKQALGYLSAPSADGRINVRSDAIAKAIRQLVQDEKADANDASAIRRATEMVAAAPPPPTGPFVRPIFGYIAQWASEVAEDRAITDGLLAHADKYLNPTWERGGLFYPRSGTDDTDADGNWVRVEPFTGNAAIAYARLNVFDGQRKMWDKPWTRERFADYAYVDGVGLGGGVDFLRGMWDGENMVVTVRSWDESEKRLAPAFHNLPKGKYGVYVDGALADVRDVAARGEVVEVPLTVGKKEVDLVLVLEK
ncbi:Linalool dehydratase-isomerase [Mycena indigotica]|uniref:Linalool dehydratase-isomerase n=1 Tax=Mycena indigotica TaxID=2126181 RepID=A0A8H6SZI8_9AGAR|nr:Linalool dehydratase-isomerase [Mycena indigotica]KAF7307526.1 Linalool dehydratase-isomerase [Mycena indigotica]